jgi:protein O-GlcNAc transferase
MSTNANTAAERAKRHFFDGLDALDAGDAAAAETEFKAALAIVPDRVSALVNLAVALFQQEKLGEAITTAQRALARDPKATEALVTMGSAYAKLGDIDAAIAAMDQATARAPNDPLALMGRASVLLKLKRFDQALAAYEAARRIKPDLEGIQGMIVKAKIYNCDWSDLDSEIDALVSGIRTGTASAEPFTLLAMRATPADQLRCAAAVIAHDYRPQPPLWNGERYTHERIRIAYVSGDYRNHPLSRLMAGIFEHHDRAGFEVIAVATNPDDGSPERQRIVAAPERFVDLGTRSNSEIAQWLRAAEVDIAIDLSGLTDKGRTRAFAMRPAPIQVSYLGFPGTSGAPYLDYLIADRFVIPEEQRPFYSEKIVTLPDTYYPTDDRWPATLRAPSRTAMGLPESAFVFCCFNNSYKITPQIFDVWMRLLKAVPGSVLWLLATNPPATANLLKEARLRGVEPHRLVFAKHDDFERYLARQQLADLALDTLPYNAHTTAVDALWVGLPMVTCPGETFPSRVAASLLNAMGLPELVTPSLADYEALALALACNPVKLAAVQRKVAANRPTTALFDTARRTRHLEAAYSAMMERHRRAEEPADLAVAPVGSDERV